MDNCYHNDAVIFGFDSAWSDKNLGAICAITFDKKGKANFIQPQMVKFDDALEFIKNTKKNYAYSLVAIDQPIIVTNKTGFRPVEKVAASVVSFVGGGVQPSYINKDDGKMFGDKSPIQKFLKNLKAVEDPKKAKIEKNGLFVIEVFPALALPALYVPFSQRYGAPKYNPKNKKFKCQDWNTIAKEVIAKKAKKFKLTEMKTYAETIESMNTKPKKDDQDKLDSVICALVGLMWRRGESSAMIGDIDTGYMITPVSKSTKERLEKGVEKQMKKNNRVAIYA